MNFKSWIINEADFYQKMFPFATEENPPDVNKIKRYKSLENYIKAMTKGGRNTEAAAEKLISAKPNHWVVGGGGEKLTELIPSALIIPSVQMPDGRNRPEFHIAFAHFTTNEPVNVNVEKYNRPRHRILAFWQGRNPSFSKEEALNGYPIGGVSYVGNYIDTVWVSPEYRYSDQNNPSLYKALREFAKRRGAADLEPGDDLTSKDFRAAQAKYDWKRAQEILSQKK